MNPDGPKVRDQGYSIVEVPDLDRIDIRWVGFTQIDLYVPSADEPIISFNFEGLLAFQRAITKALQLASKVEHANNNREGASDDLA